MKSAQEEFDRLRKEADEMIRRHPKSATYIEAHMLEVQCILFPELYGQYRSQVNDLMSQLEKGQGHLPCP